LPTIAIWRYSVQMLNLYGARQIPTRNLAHVAPIQQHRPRKQQANQWFTEPGQTAFTNALAPGLNFTRMGLD
jgi:hypothetical protein